MALRNVLEFFQGRFSKSMGLVEPTRQSDTPDVFKADDESAALSTELAGKEFEKAITRVLTMTPELLSRPGLRKEKLNHLLYLARRTQAGGTAKHGYQKLQRKLIGIRNNLKGVELPTTGGFAEVGCGAHDPIALSACMFANGAEPNYAIDLLPPHNEIYSAYSMYDVLANMLLFPDRYVTHGVNEDVFCERIRAFDIRAFEAGDFRGGYAPLSNVIRYEVTDIVSSTIAPNSLKLMVTFAVLEHVSDIAEVAHHIHRLLKPGGVAFHFIDMGDHRAYAYDGNHHPLSFLTQEVGPEGVNRLRGSEHIAAQDAAGFEIVKKRFKYSDVPQFIRENLVERYRALPEDDYAAVRLWLVVRKPVES